MAKKKLNKQVAAFAATAAIVVVGGGFAAYKLYRGSYQPGLMKKEGRELMLKGDYVGAFNDFARVANRGSLSTDMEFLGWMYEASMHRTSVTDSALKDSRNLLEQMLATRPNDVDTIVSKLKFDLDLLDAGGTDQFSADQAKRMGELAKQVLAKSPKNPVAIRADAAAIAMPLFKQDTSQTSADIEAIVNDIRARLDANADNADLLTVYAVGVGRLRDTLLREHAIEPNPNDPRVKEMFKDLDGRVESLLKSLADETKPADVRASGYARASRIDQVIGMSGFVSTREGETQDAQRLYDRRQKSLASAAALVPPKADLFVPVRIEQANALAQQEKFEDAEKLLRDTIAAVPDQWQPRLFLADLLTDRGRAAESLELVSVTLKPGPDLIGVAGYQFLYDQRQVPMRRAFYRLQNLQNAKAVDREKETKSAQADYDLAIATSKISESDPYALQVQAAFQELKLDRTGALQTLTRALETAPNDRLKLRLQSQLVSLNLALNQPGAASAMLEQLYRNPSLTPQARINSVLQLIDLRIRNGATEQARLLLDQAKKMLPDHPALMALEIKLISDPVAKKKAFDNFPEATAPQRFFKLQFAARDLQDEPSVRRLATDILKADPNALDVAMLYGDFLRRHDKREEAIAIFQDALKAHPDDKNLEVLIKDTQAVTAEDRKNLLPEAVTDPYRRALIEAEQLRLAGDVENYMKRIREAEAIDKDKDGTATERIALYYIANQDVANATAAIDRLATMNRDPAQIRVLRLRLLIETNNVAEAMAQSDAITGELPNYSPGWVMKGQAYMLGNQLSQATDAYETALGQQPDNIEALHGVVEAADRSGRRDLVKRYLDQGLRASKNSDDFFVDWSLRYEQSYGDPVVTIEPRLKRRDASPADPGKWFALAQAYLASANAKERSGESVAAADYRAKALDVFKQAGAKFPGAGGFVLEAARLVAQDKDVEGAVKMVDAMDAAEQTPEIQLLRARFYMDMGRLDTAMALLQKQVDTGKANDAIRMQLSTAQASSNQPDAALKTIESLADAATVREMRMNILVAAGRLPEAQKLVSDALEKERSIPNLLMSAMIAARQDRIVDGLKLADEAVARDSENPTARFTRARIMLGEKPLRNNDLIADLLVVRKNAPQNLEARLALVERLRALSRGLEATQELEAIQRDVPGDRRVITQLVQAYASEVPPRFQRIDQLLADVKKMGAANDPQLLMIEARVSLQRGDTARAIAAARAAANAASNDFSVTRGMLAIMLRADSFADVIAEVDRVQKDNSALYWTYLTRGIALHRLKRESEAASEFDRAVGLAQALKDPSDAVLEVGSTYAQEYGAELASSWIEKKLPADPSTKVLQMKLLTAAGKTDKSIAVYEQLAPQLQDLALPARIQVLATVGSAYLMSTPPKASNAQTIFALLNDLEPNNMMTLNNLAYAMTLSNNGSSLQEAVTYARKAYELAEQNAVPNASITDTYGWTLVQSGNIDEGLTKLREAFETGGLPETEYHIGEVYLTQGQKDVALQTLRSALGKVNAAKQSGSPYDATLIAHIEGAIKRAEELATP